MLDDVMKDIQKMNSKANWTNLAAGVALLLVLAGASLWYFSKNTNTDDLSNEFSLEKTSESNAPAVSGAESKAEEGAKPSSNPVVEKLPYTSSK